MTHVQSVIKTARTNLHGYSSSYLREKWSIVQRKLKLSRDTALLFVLTHRSSCEGLRLSGRISFRRLLYFITLLVASIVLYKTLSQPLMSQYVKYQKPNIIETTGISMKFKTDNESQVVFAQTKKSAKLRTEVRNFIAIIDENKEPSITDQSGAKSETPLKSNGRYWFFEEGTVWPTKYDPLSNQKKPKIWPHEAPGQDRIVDQLMYIPPDYNPHKIKTILLPNEWAAWNVPVGTHAFHVCPVKACSLTNDVSQIDNADAVMFRDTITVANVNRSSNQLWIIFVMNSVAQTLIRNLGDVNGDNEVNWTATYRMDSDIVTPYGKWLYYDDAVKTLEENKLTNFAANKTLKVAWFVSNCEAANHRLEYVLELQSFISVDIYGKCGKLVCPLTSYSTECFDMLNDNYKFYLSFESANCVDYITEKFFTNALRNNIIPIVMGAPKEFYQRSAPNHSFIHVDDFHTPEELAKYLYLLDKDDSLYNSYFRWKGTGEFIDTFFWCRLCTMLHDAERSEIHEKYPDIEQWWNQADSCREDSWSDPLKKRKRK